jgi:hypothetical protein
MTTLTKQVFKISYDTDETIDHTIDAEHLGQAIISTAKALKNADKVINGEDSELELDVKAHSEGSFVVEFVTYINSLGVNPLTVLGFVAGGGVTATVLGAIKQLNSRKIKLVEKVAGGNTKLHLNDNTSMELPANVAELVVNKAFRKEIETVIKAPLEGAQNAKFIIKDEHGSEVFKVEEAETESYKTLPANIVDEVTDSTATKNVRFTKVNFDSATGWQVKFSDNETAAVTMKDDAFLERMNNNREKFSKGDLFVVKLKITKTHRHGTSPHYKREVIEVVRNRTEGGRQLSEQ